MSVFHDHWSLSWNMDAFTTKASIVPAVVLTYIGMGAPYDNHLVEVATKEANGISAPADVRVSAAATLDLTNLQSALRFSGGVNTSTIAAGKVRPVWVWIELPEAAREQISQVRYEFNHPTFRSPKAAEKGSGVYLAKWLGYGCINDAAVVATLKTGREIRAPFDLCDLWQNGRVTTN